MSWEARAEADTAFSIGDSMPQLESILFDFGGSAGKSVNGGLNGKAGEKMRDGKRWLLVLSAVFVLYAWFMFERFLHYERGYIFDSATGDVFEIELRPEFRRYKRWKHFNPFVDPPYWVSSAAGIEYRGRLMDLIEDRREWEADFDAKNLEFTRELEEELKSDKDIDEIERSRIEEYFYLYATDYNRWDIEISVLVPPQWEELLALVEKGHATIYAADVVIGGWATGNIRYSSPPEFKIIRSALVLRQDAFEAVNTYCLMRGSSYLWAACQ